MELHPRTDIMNGHSESVRIPVQSRMCFPSEGTQQTQRRNLAAAELVTDCSSAVPIAQQSKQSTRDQLIRRRELGRKYSQAYQARRRKQYQERVTALESSNQRLREEIQRLGQHRQHVGRGPSATADFFIWKVATEYFRLFSNGFVLKCPQVQEKFLRSTMAPDTAEDQLKSWHQRSLYVDNMNMELMCLEEGAKNTLVATGWGSSTISENMLRNVFPHLLTTDGKDNRALIVTKLLGRQLKTRFSVRFEWDNASGRVIDLQYEADMLKPVLQLLGNLEDVSLVFDNALISPECVLVTREL